MIATNIVAVAQVSTEHHHPVCTLTEGADHQLGRDAPGAGLLDQRAEFRGHRIGLGFDDTGKADFDEEAREACLRITTLLFVVTVFEGVCGALGLMTTGSPWGLVGGVALCGVILAPGAGKLAEELKQCWQDS